LMKQRVLIPVERVLGCLLMGLSLVLAAPWVRSRIRGRVWASDSKSLISRRKPREILRNAGNPLFL
jgi:hypothetical protein